MRKHKSASARQPSAAAPGGGIIIRGAHEHNLKHLNLVLPRNRLIVITGLSGSGKSSLAFDTLYAEGQRRYVESLSAYARQFLERLEKPDVESIEGLSPAIAIEQRGAGGNPRSTVATQTEIYDYLRVLFARAGQPHCPACRVAISRQSAQEMVTQILAQPATGPLTILAPLVRGRKGEHAELLREAKQQGFIRVRVDRIIRELDEPIALNKKRAHTLEVVVDRLSPDRDNASRLTESIETALKVGKGLVIISREPAGGSRLEARGKNRHGASSHEPRATSDLVFSELYACPQCGFSIEELSPRIFSFNSPYGACQTCDGLGTRLELDPDLVVPDRTKSLREGAIEPWKRGNLHMVMYYNRLLREVIRFYRIDSEMPFGSLPRQQQRALLHGSNDEIWGDVWEGVIPNLERRFRQTSSDYVKEEIAKRMSVLPCATCQGTRLNEASRAVLIDGRSIAALTTLSVTEAAAWCARQAFPAAQQAITGPILKEIRTRFQFLIDVGLGYLTLDRPSASLSGGEAQRIRLATQVGSGLVGVLYILDEPSIGLHQRDNDKLLNTLLRLRDLGNTVVVVEHDEATIRRADYIVDLGPGAGPQGGELVACGTLEDVLQAPRSLTGQFLGGTRWIPVPSARRAHAKRQALVIRGAREHNLKGINVTIPLGCFVCVTGVSGSGKSTLVDEILYRALARRFYGSREKPGAHEGIAGIEHLDKVIVIDQSPIGRTPRSNPATYTDAFGPIRELFSRTSDARLRGFKPGRFSFNVKGGRCEACQGDGIKRIEMHFLPDVYVRCEVCKGRRFNDRTLQVTYKSHSIAEVLSMTVDQALAHFAPVPAIAEKLRTIQAVGLGYLELGQSATTLSGGEAQRIKLSKELSRRATGRTLYVLDEPTTGLHFADVEKLLAVLHQLVDQGNTVLVVEHNLEVVKTADYVIDLGPEGGAAGGELVAAGSPEDVAKQPRSHTGRCLAPLLGGPRGSLSTAIGRAAVLLAVALGACMPAANAQSPVERQARGAEAPASRQGGPSSAYLAIQRAFLAEDYAGVVDHAAAWLAKPVSGPEAAQAHIWIGVSFSRVGRIDDALQALERVKTAMSPADALYQEVLYWEGDLSRRSGRPVRAKLAWTRLLNQFPKSTWAPRAHLGLGIIAMAEQASRQALESFRAAAWSSGDSQLTLHARILEGVCLLQLENPKAAYEAFQQLLTKAASPEDLAWIWYYQGQALAGLGRHTEAIVAYERARQLRPDSDLATLALFGIGWAQFHSAQCEQSLETFNDYARRARGAQRVEALFAQGSCLARLGKEDRAVQALGRATASGLSHPLAFESGLLLADLYRRQGQTAQATKLLERLRQEAPGEATRVQVELRMAGVRLDEGDPAGARRFMQAALKGTEIEKRREELNGLGDLLMELGDFDEASRRFQRVLELSDVGPTADHALYQLGRLHLARGESEEALQIFEMLMPRVESGLAADVHLAIAFTHMVSGSLTEAKRQLAQLRDTHPGTELAARAGYYVALLVLDEGRPEQARRLCQEAVKRAPRSDEGLEAELLLAQLEAANGSLNQAMQALRARFAEAGTTLRHRGRLAQQLGDFSRRLGAWASAIAWYERAATLLPGRNGEVLYRIASCYEEGGDFELAIARYRAIADEGWDVRGGLAAAKLLERQGDWDAAEAIYETLASEPVPEAKVAREHLALLRGESTTENVQ